MAMVLSVCSVAVATEVSFTNYDGIYGPIKIPIYTMGHCRFRCVTPDGWRADVQRGGDEAVRFTPPGTSAVFIAILAAPVSRSAHELQSWRVPELKRELCADRPFTMQNESWGVCDGAPCWSVWGIVTNAPAAQTGMRAAAVVEHHRYCIRNGYLIHVLLSAPVHDYAQYLDAFTMVTMTFRSHAFEVTWSCLDMTSDPTPESAGP